MVKYLAHHHVNQRGKRLEYHHSTIRDMMVASSHVLSLILGGKYPMGI